MTSRGDRIGALGDSCGCSGDRVDSSLDERDSPVPDGDGVTPSGLEARPVSTCGASHRFHAVPLSTTALDRTDHDTTLTRSLEQGSRGPDEPPSHAVGATRCFSYAARRSAAN